jgi:hypothetical protein
MTFKTVCIAVARYSLWLAAFLSLAVASGVVAARFHITWLPDLAGPLGGLLLGALVYVRHEELDK